MRADAEFPPPSFHGRRIGEGLERLSDGPSFNVTREEATTSDFIAQLRFDPLVSRFIDVMRVTSRLYFQPTRELLHQVFSRDLMWWFVASMVTAYSEHRRYWKLLWAKNLPPGTNQYSLRQRSSQSVDEVTIRELGWKAGVNVSLPLPDIAAKVEAQWSQLLRKRVHIVAQEEVEEILTFNIPREGLDIALWELRDVYQIRWDLEQLQEIVDDINERRVEPGRARTAADAALERMLERREADAYVAAFHDACETVRSKLEKERQHDDLWMYRRLFEPWAVLLKGVRSKDLDRLAKESDELREPTEVPIRQQLTTRPGRGGTI